MRLLRVFLALQLLLSGLAPVAAQVWTSGNDHDSCCCSCTASEDLSAPSWQAPSCSCGCIQPYSPADEDPSQPRVPSTSNNVELATKFALAETVSIYAAATTPQPLRSHTLRGPPGLERWRLSRPALSSWQE